MKGKRRKNVHFVILCVLETNQQKNRHIASVHEGIKAYSCPICDARFTESKAVPRHISVVS